MQITADQYPLFMQKPEFNAVLKELGLSKKVLAQRLGVSHSTVLHWNSPPDYAYAYLMLLVAAKKLLEGEI